MSASRSKRHHFIPQFLLKNWSGDNDKVWLYNKRARRIDMTSISNVFVKNNLYTVQTDLDSRKSDGYEMDFAREEGMVSPVLRRIIETARNKDTLNLTEREDSNLKRFLLSIPRRTPESQKRIQNSEVDAFYEAVNSQPGAKCFGFDDPKILYKYEKIRQLRNLLISNTSAKFAAGRLQDHAIEVEEYVSTSGLGIFVIRNPRRSLAIGSFGYSEEIGGNKAENRANAIWIPVAPDIALTFIAKQGFRKILYLDHNYNEEGFVRRFNKFMVTQSDFIVAKDKQMLEAFKKKERRRLRS